MNNNNILRKAMTKAKGKAHTKPPLQQPSPPPYNTSTYKHHWCHQEDKHYENNTQPLKINYKRQWQ